MQSAYKTEQLIDEGVDFTKVYAEKQEVVKDMTGFDFNLSNIVKFLQKETKQFTQQLPLALDIDRSIFSIYEKWKQSKGEEAEAKPQPKSEEPKEEPKKENSTQIEEWKEVVETYLEFIALGSTEENIAEWTEAVETYRMFIESEEPKMAKGGGVGEIDMDNVQEQAEYYTDEKAWSIKPTIEKFESEIREYENLRYKLDNNLIKPSKIIGSGIKPNLVRPLAYKWLNERILVCKKAIEILKKREGNYAKGGGVGYKKTKNGVAYQIIQLDSPMGKYKYVIKGVKFGGFGASYITNDVLSETEIERIAEKNKMAKGGGVKEDFRGTLSTDALPYLLKDTPYRYQIEDEFVYGTLKEIEFAKKFLKDNYNIDSTIRDKNKVGFKKLEVLTQIIE